MPSVTVYPTGVDFGSSSALSLVGGAAGLSDGSDSTYLQVTDVNGVNGAGATVTFQPWDAIPPGSSVSYTLLARYAQLSGPSASPTVGQIVDGVGTLILNMPDYATSGGPVVDGVSYPLDLGNYPVTLDWELGLSFPGGSGGDFRIYEMALVGTYAEPVPTETVGGWKVGALR